MSDFVANIVHVCHFIIPLVLVALLVGNDRLRLRKKNRPLFDKIFAIFQLIYISKIFGLLAFMFSFVISGAILLVSDYQLNWINYPFATIATLLPFFLLPYGILVNRHRYQVRRVEVKLPNLPIALRGLKIVQISDIHSGSFFDNSGFEKGVHMINDLRPDLIFFTGDLVNNRAVEILPFIDTFSQLKATYGVYSVLGNHDYGDYVRWRNSSDKVNNLRQLIEFQKSMDWDILLNENRIVQIGEASVGIIGVENYSAKLQFPKYGKLGQAYQGAETADLQLLLTHDPSHWRYEVLKDFPEIDITFSGHTHGMQFGVEVGQFQWSPIKYVYKEWAGLYSEKNQYLYVNRGFGVLGYPGRLGILPEITLITLT